MLENLDLSGISGNINIEYSSMHQYIPTLVAMVLFFFAFRIISDIVFMATRTKRYREKIADMYVVGKIKKFAEEDDIDINKEWELYETILQKANKKDKGDLALSDAVEDNLVAKINKSTDDKLKR